MFTLELPTGLPDDPEELERTIEARENRVRHLKPDNQARIVWSDPEHKNRTEYALVYIHGFTASQGEGYPVHLDFARRFGMNLFLARLKGHGIDHPDAFRGLKPQHFIDSAAEALAIGARLGTRVILMGTSTGAALSLYLASRIDANYLKGLILYSPLIEFYGIKSWLLSNSLMRSVLRIVPGKRYMLKTRIGHPDEQKIWYPRYRLEGALALGKLIESTMSRQTFGRISLPAFVGYYYRNEQNQDTTVSVPAILKMFDNLGTDSRHKRLVNFPQAGTHVICSTLLSKSVEEVKKQTFSFTANVLALNPLKRNDI